MATEAFSVIIQNLGLAQTLVGLLVNERDRQKTATIQNDLTEKITSVQLNLCQVLTTIIEKDAVIQTLTQRNRELEAAQREKERYALAKLGTLGEVFAYQLRPAGELLERKDEPPHFVCQPCFDAGKKGVLRIGKYTATCPVCAGRVNIHGRPVERQVGSSGWVV